MDSLPALTAQDRLLVVAPHPDDEALGTGGLLQRAAEAGTAVRVIFLTDGDKNPWPQRVIERRWHIHGAAARMRWGSLRRREALTSLLTLGHDAEVAEFWSLPDQGLTQMLLSEGPALVARLGRAVSGWQPTWLAVPSASDRHPDHSAVGVAMSIALRQREGLGGSLRTLAYVVHGDAHREANPKWRLSLEDCAVATKRAAILCHGSQTLLSRNRFLAHARPDEIFLQRVTARAPARGQPLRRVVWGESGLRVDYQTKGLTRWLARPEMHVLTVSGDDEIRHHRVPLPGITRAGAVQVLPALLEPAGSSIFLKLRTGVGLYDAAGWIELETNHESQTSVRRRDLMYSAARRRC